MKKHFFTLALLAIISATLRTAAQLPGAKPEVWMMPPAAPDGRAFRELFAKPDESKETRSLINVLGYADHMLNKQFTDDELRAWFPQIQQWGLKFELETGAIKPWGTTGQKTFDIERKHWDRFQSLGGRIDSIGMDEPLCCVQKNLKKPDEYAVEETAQFIALVRSNYPAIKICEIEPYPFIPLTNHLTWIDALEKKLAEKNVRGLDFYRLLAALTDVFLGLYVIVAFVIRLFFGHGRIQNYFATLTMFLHALQRFVKLDNIMNTHCR